MTDSDTDNRHLLVLARNNPLEAMRVAAGLTIFGHHVELVLMNRELTEEESESEQGELLELCEIQPLTTVPGMQQYFEFLDSQALAKRLLNADGVINL
ncbi:MAG: hypothetical protein KTR32_22375 [Granulosicoccus sp.]|nr:hypothetical protein [Granulosicoccus sp.]